MEANFERCLAVTLHWEGGYSNHPDDPGGPTMRGVIQREYDKWRLAHHQSKQPVHKISEEELRAIYRQNYWEACACGGLEAGLDLCVFDAAVNSGVDRALGWLEEAKDIESFTAKRLQFLQGLGRLWRVFGKGWNARVRGIRNEAIRMHTGNAVAEKGRDGSLHAGMRGAAVKALQERLRALGYPCGVADGIFGEQTYRAVVLFQHDHGLEGDAGVWLGTYDEALNGAEPMLPKRRLVTHRDLEEMGDKPVARVNFIQRCLGWVFGASAVGQVFDSGSVVDSLTGLQGILDPLQGLMAWASEHKWIMLAVIAVGLIALLRAVRSSLVTAYQNFDYQGTPAQPKGN